MTPSERAALARAEAAEASVTKLQAALASAESDIRQLRTELDAARKVVEAARIICDDHLPPGYLLLRNAIRAYYATVRP